MDDWELFSKYIQLFGQMTGVCITEEGKRQKQQNIRRLSLELGIPIQTKLEDY